MVEEYDIKSHLLLTRKWKKSTTFKSSKWEFEIGEQDARVANEGAMFKVSSQNVPPTTDSSRFSCERTPMRSSSLG